MSERIAAKNRAKILAGIRSMGNAEAARILDCSENTISELGNGKYKFNFNSAGELLARMGYKIVKDDQVCCNQKKLEWVLGLAKEAMANMDTDQLEWDED